jgi:acyl-CoA reductase-like NAD-dependent aldehyde dehydrogenase
VTSAAATIVEDGFILAGATTRTAQVIAIRSPFDDVVVGEVSLAAASHADQGLEAATRALRRGLAPHVRADVLDAAAALLKERREDFAALIRAEVGKPITLARAEVDRAGSTLRFAAAVARTASGQGLTIDAAPSGSGKLAFTKALPIGIVAAITPFNFPLNLVAHKLAPAIAAGCPVLLKPAPQAPLTALAFGRLLLDAGLPGDFLSVLPGLVDGVGRVLVEDDRVAAITFTGSTKVGWQLRQAAPKKKVLLELGNSAPAIVHEDADLDLAASKLTAGAFAYAGQSCVSVQRVLVHREVEEELMSRLAANAVSVGVGDPADEAVIVGPVIDDRARDRITGWLDEAIAGGARRLAGGDVSGRVIAPTIVAAVPRSCALAQEEIFGPVFTIDSYTDVDAAFREANSTRFALQASIFTTDLRLALDATDQLEFGAVLVNEAPTFRTDAMPYGGGRDSGNTREGPASTVKELTEERLVIIDQAATRRRPSAASGQGRTS